MSKKIYLNKIFIYNANQSTMLPLQRAKYVTQNDDVYLFTMSNNIYANIWLEQQKPASIDAAYDCLFPLSAVDPRMALVTNGGKRKFDDVSVGPLDNAATKEVIRGGLRGWVFTRRGTRVGTLS